MMQGLLCMHSYKSSIVLITPVVGGSIDSQAILFVNMYWDYKGLPVPYIQRQVYFLLAASLQSKFSCLYEGAKGTAIEAAEVCGHYGNEEGTTRYARTLACYWS